MKIQTTDGSGRTIVVEAKELNDQQLQYVYDKCIIRVVDCEFEKKNLLTLIEELLAELQKRKPQTVEGKAELVN